MLGAIAGDIIGSIYEGSGKRIKTTSFPLFSADSKFTDDSVLTVAVADCIINQKPFALNFKQYFGLYPHAGYGHNFIDWVHSNSLEPYSSYGNGSAMRVSPIGFAYNDLDTVLAKAKESAEVTHNHPEGIKGAQAVASAIFLARTGQTKEQIKAYIESTFAYDLSRSIASIRPAYVFDVACQKSVPESIIAFLESTDYESAVRIAVSLGGDSDTMACIAGGIAQAFYKKIPVEIIKETYNRLDARLAGIIQKFVAMDSVYRRA